MLKLHYTAQSLCEKKVSYLGQRSAFRENARASERRSREGQRKGPLAGPAPRSRVLARLTQIGERARRLGLRIQPIHLAAWVAPRNVRSGGSGDYLRTGATFERIVFLLPAECNLILRSALRELHPWSLQTHWISLT